MDFKSILTQLSQLSEAETRKIAGRAYGGAAQHDDEEDDDGTDTKKVKHDTPKRGRGRPPKTGAHTQSPEEKKRLKSREEAGKQLQSYIVGNQPKKSKELEKLPKTKHSLKEWVEEVEQKYVTEAEQITMEPAKQNTQVIKQGTKTLGTVSNPQLAAQIKQSIGKGEMSLAGDQLGETDMSEAEEKWIKKAIKSPGAFTKKAKSHGMTTSAFANKVLSNKEDYPAKTEKQAQLAKTLGKLKEGDIPTDQNDVGAGLGAGRNNKTFEGKKPDFLDLDKDKNKKEPMSDAAKDAEKKKKKLKENAHKHSAARLLGKAHALARESYNCKYDDLDEVKMYHEGYKEGLDECYGQGVYEGVAEGSLEEVSLALAKRARDKATDDAYNDGDDLRGKEEGHSYRQSVKFQRYIDKKEPRAKGGPKKGVAEGDEPGYIKYEQMKDKISSVLIKLYNQGKDAETIKQMADRVAHHLGYDPEDSIFQDAWMSSFTDASLDGSLDQDEEDYTDYSMRQGEMGRRGMDEGNAFTAALAKTPKGEKFTLGGKSFTDTSNYGDSLGEMAFESLDKQLNDLLNETSVSEGMSVSISKGNQGAPDTVSITAQDGEADQLLSIIKQAGLGLFGQEAGATDSLASHDSEKHGDIDVVGDHDGMMALIKKVTDDGDYAEEGSEDTSTCEECGHESCQCEDESVEETESYYQEEENVAEANYPDSDEAETTADENAEAQEDSALADELNELDQSTVQSYKDKADPWNRAKSGDTTDAMNRYEKGQAMANRRLSNTTDQEQVTEWANDAGESSSDFDEENFKADIDFITKTISGGLNKSKSTGQTTIPVIAGQEDRMTNESISDWIKLAGLK